MEKDKKVDAEAGSVKDEIEMAWEWLETNDPELAKNMWEALIGKRYPGPSRPH
jgi:hypothetical protein